MNLDYLQSPLGWLKIVADDQHVLEIRFVDQPEEKAHPNSITNQARKQLEEYFSSERQQFDLPLNPQGTEFQKKVWRALQAIPFGSTLSYKQVAQMIRNPRAVRAVGLANGKNPIPIVIPCHRVIAADGQLGGYSAGLWCKVWLLKHEGLLVQATAKRQE